mmetsp:Transcript_2626/g.8789  ORF Transcript_2626/g.8789 Transcript_2626/m.8789 type:complete len:90 (-) Transcript_2626:1768-2037(-)
MLFSVQQSAPIITESSFVSMSNQPVPTNFVQQVEVPRQMDDEDTDALMARIDRTLAEANRTLGQNSVEHGVKKIHASEHAPDFVDGIKV